jgi:hypothetical protein
LKEASLIKHALAKIGFPKVAPALHVSVLPSSMKHRKFTHRTRKTPGGYQVARRHDPATMVRDAEHRQVPTG